MTADFVVIGGGMAGVSIAANLLGVGGAARTSEAAGSVLLLEAEKALAHHTTGRSAAKFLETYGAAQIRALTRASRPLYDAGSADPDTPDLLTPGPEMIVADTESASRLEARLAEVPSLRRLTVDEAREICPALSPSYLAGAAIEDGAADIDVLGLHQHYLRAARRHGLEVRSGTRVVAAERTDDTWRIRITSDGAGAAGAAGNGSARDGSAPGGAGGNGSSGRGSSGDGAARDGAARDGSARDGSAGSGPGADRSGGDEVIEAGVVINAAGAWADRIASVFGAAPVGLAPLRRTIAIVNADGVRRGWPIVADMAETFYFRPEGDALLVSPTDETPSDPVDARPEDLDVALAIDRVNAATTLNIRSVRTAWAGLRTFAPDRLPVVGYAPEPPGFFWLAGQGGYGIQMAPALASTAASLVRGEPVPTEILAEGVHPDALTPNRFTT